MGKTVATAHASQQNTSGGLFQEAWSVPGKCAGTGEQETNDVVAQDRQATTRRTYQQSSTHGEHRPNVQPDAQLDAQLVVQHADHADEDAADKRQEHTVRE